MGTQLPPPRKGTAGHICCGQMAARIKMPLGMEVGLGPGDFVLDEDPALSPQKGGGVPPPKKNKKLAHVYCGHGQTAVWLNMVLRMEVGLSPGDFVLDGHSGPPSQKRGRAPSPIFGPCLLWPNG